jgi:hypothetical protein
MKKICDAVCELPTWVKNTPNLGQDSFGFWAGQDDALCYDEEGASMSELAVRYYLCDLIPTILDDPS